MSILAPAEGGSSSLEVVLRKAGAVFANHEGRSAAIHYGSAAGELAVCVSAVGLVRSIRPDDARDRGPPALSSLSSPRAWRAARSLPGGALDADGAWWCAAAPDTLVVVCRPDVRRRLLERLRVHAAHQVSLRVLSVEFAAIGLLGRRTPDVLRALGVYGSPGDPRAVAPFGRGSVAGVDAWWLLESDRSALMLVDRERAGEVWRAIEHAGRPFGLSCVGQEAAGRYALLERTRTRAALVG